MDQQVAKSLGELELKLQELERELTTIGHRDEPAKPGHVPGKLVDEAVEGEGKIDPPQVEAAATVDSDAFGGPAVFGGEEVPAQPGATIEREWTADVRETAYGEIPTPPSPGAPPSQTPPLPPPASFSRAASFPAIGESQPSAPDATAAASPGPSPYALDSSQPHSSAGDPADVDELVRFRDKLMSTMNELIDEYSRLLHLEPPSRPRSGA